MKDSIPKEKRDFLNWRNASHLIWLEFHAYMHFYFIILTRLGHQGIETFLVGTSLPTQFSPCVDLNLFIVLI